MPSGAGYREEYAAKVGGVGSSGDAGVGPGGGNAEEAPVFGALSTDAEGGVLPAGEGGVDEDGGGERVPGEVAAGGEGVGLGAKDFGGETGEAGEVGRGEGDLIGRVEADDAEGPAGAEHGVGGKRVEPGVPFGRGSRGDVAGRVERAAHPDEVAEGSTQAGLLPEREAEVGEGAEGEDVDRRPAEQAAFEVRGGGFGLRAEVDRGMRPEQLPGGGAPRGREGGITGQGPGGADVDRDPRAPAVGQQAGHRFSAGGGFGEAVHNGDGFDSYLGALEEEQQRQQVVGAGVGVDNHGTDGLRAEAQG